MSLTLDQMGSELRATAVRSSFLHDDFFQKLRDDGASAADTQRLSRQVFQQGEMLKEFSRTAFSELQQIGNPDGSKTYRLEKTIDGEICYVSIKDTEVLESFEFRAAHDASERGRLARDCVIDESKTVVTIDGEPYHVTMTIPLRFGSPGGEVLIKLEYLVLNASLSVLIAAALSGVGFATFVSALLDIQAAPIRALISGLISVIRITWLFFSRFLAALLGGAELSAAFFAARLAISEAVAALVFAAFNPASFAAFLVGGLTMALLWAVSTYVLHETYQNVFVVNLTKKIVRFTIPYIYHGNHYHLTSAAIAPRGPLYTGTVYLGDFYNGTAFRFESDSVSRGLGYAIVLQIVDPASQAVEQAFTCHFDLPFFTPNALLIHPFEYVDQGWFSCPDLTPRRTECSAQGGLYMCTTTYDYLSDMHKDPEDGVDKYLYNSLIVVRHIPGTEDWEPLLPAAR